MNRRNNMSGCGCGCGRRDEVGGASDWGSCGWSGWNRDDRVGGVSDHDNNRCGCGRREEVGGESDRDNRRCGCGRREEVGGESDRDNRRCGCGRRDEVGGESDRDNNRCGCGRHDRTEPSVANLDAAAKRNDNFRKAFWTGEHLQVTLMSLKPCEDIGAETHEHTDQLICVVCGTGTVTFGGGCGGGCLCGSERSCPISEGDCVFIPAGTRHNITNTGSCDLKLISVYAPPEHPANTVQETKPSSCGCRCGRRS